MEVLGYTTQAHFLINCGLLAKMELAAAELAGRLAAKLMMEHEMGELFKVLALGKGAALGCRGLYPRRPHPPLTSGQAGGAP